jgi:hypothetical protein
MNLTRKFSVIALFGLLIIATACSFNVSTANIGGLKLGKDKEMQQETKTFEATETIYSAVTISNNPGTVKVKGSLQVVEIEGQKAGPIPGTEATVTIAGAGTANFNFTPPTNGWPQGKYKFEAMMLNEDGEQKDSKSQDFTVQ